jgi:hypothetical protein
MSLTALALLGLVCGMAGTVVVIALLHSRSEDAPQTYDPASWRHVWETPSLVGMAAPDFTLPGLKEGQQVHLAELRARRPVVLVFGSFS